MRARYTLLLAIALFPALAAAATPDDWHFVSNSTYLMDRDTAMTYAGRPSVRLMSVGRPEWSGVVMKDMPSGPYLGKRIRLSGYVRARNVTGGAGLWMRVDSETNPHGCGQMLALDNMEDRPIERTSDWTRYDVVLDVAKEAKGIAYGMLLKGMGTVWLGDVSIEVVGTDVPTTGTWGRERTVANPNFDH